MTDKTKTYLAKYKKGNKEHRVVIQALSLVDAKGRAEIYREEKGYKEMLELILQNLTAIKIDNGGTFYYDCRIWTVYRGEKRIFDHVLVTEKKMTRKTIREKMNTFFDWKIDYFRKSKVEDVLWLK